MKVGLESPIPVMSLADHPEISQQWCWEIIPDLANVGLARQLVEEVASTVLNPAAVFDLVLATSEVVTNAIKAAVANGLTNAVALSLTRSGDCLTLTCIDSNGQTREARRIPPVQYLNYHTRQRVRWSKRDWRRWRRCQSLGKGIPLTDRLSRNNGGDGFILVRDGAQVRASLTMRIGFTVSASSLADQFAADIAALAVA